MREVGFNAYLTKPVKQSYLYDAIMSVTAGEGEHGPRESQTLITKHTLNEARRSRMRILVAEDNLVNQKVLSRMLESLGYRCDLADHGQAAIEALERQPYDVIFMDCQMPVMDGFEATRRIRLLDCPECDVPIVATTADALKGDRERCIEAGMNEYISKPIDRGELAATLDRITSRTADEPQEPGPSVPDQPEEPPRPVEIERLQAISSGDVTFEKRILALYVQESLKRSTAIVEALENADFEVLREEAHATKGSSGNIGADVVSELAGRLQTAAEARDRAACVEISAALARANDDANSFIETYVRSLGVATDGADHE
jgi:CheY-like chemotaxis protein